MPIVCAIHQPNFFPWLGYFDKIKRSDVFVFLDDIQNTNSGRSYVNRTKLNCNGQEKWYTCPINRPSGIIKINEVEFSSNEWDQKFLEVLTNYYRKHPNFKKTIVLISDLVTKKEYMNLSELNKDIIIHFSDYFGYKTQFISKSSLEIDSKSTQMLIDICKVVGSDTYLCGGGASGYQDDDLFKASGINLKYQHYTPTCYGDEKLFLPGLSVIDYLMGVA